jgi:hypothetical protein
MKQDQTIMVSKRMEDLALRLAGAVVAAAAYQGTHLLSQVAPQQSGPPHTILPYMLAFGTFLSGSVGAALLIYGRQLGQHIAVSDRWATPADFRHRPASDQLTGETGR